MCVRERERARALALTHALARACTLRPQILAHAVDFDGALLAARRRLKRPEGSVDDAMSDASRVLAGEKVFEPLDAVEGAQRCGEWLDESAARLLQHQLITAPGWTEPPAVRCLELHAPLPPHVEEVAAQLAHLFDGEAPNSCEVYACEPGQRSSATSPTGTPLAILTLHGECEWACAGRDGAESTLAIPARSVTVLPAEVEHAMLPARQRHLSLRFRRAD